MGAAYFAVKLDANRLEVWSERERAGFYSADEKLVQGSMLLPSVGYSEAIELATLSSPAFHPFLLPVVKHRDIPMYLYSFAQPSRELTRVETDHRMAVAAKPTSISSVIANASSNPVSTDHGFRGIYSKRDVVIVSMEDVGMWQQVGFLARVFAIFMHHRISVGLVATSETTVTVSLDSIPSHIQLNDLVEHLSELCKTSVVFPCMAVSLIGSNMSEIFRRLSPALQVLSEKKLWLVSQAAFNLTFVLEEESPDAGSGILQSIHDAFFPRVETSV